MATTFTLKRKTFCIEEKTFARRATVAAVGRMRKAHLPQPPKPKPLPGPRFTAPTQQVSGKNVVNLQTTPKSTPGGGTTINFNDALNQVKNNTGIARPRSVMTGVTKTWENGGKAISTGKQVAGANVRSGYVENAGVSVGKTKTDVVSAKNIAARDFYTAEANKPMNYADRFGNLSEKSRARLAEMRQSRLTQTKPAANSTIPKSPTPPTPTPKPVSNTNNNGLGWLGQGTTGQKQKTSNNKNSHTPTITTPPPKPTPTTTPSKPVANTNNGLGWTGQGTTGQRPSGKQNKQFFNKVGAGAKKVGKGLGYTLIGTTALAGYGLKKIDDAANGY